MPAYEGPAGWQKSGPSTIAPRPSSESITVDVGAQAFDDGTAANPGFSWSGDDTTGFYLPAAGEMGVTVSGTERARWIASGLRFDGDGNQVLDESENAHITINDGGDTQFERTLDVSNNDIVDGGTTIWDASAGALVASELFADGTEADPSVSFVNDDDLGFWRPGANTIGLATSGTERLRVDTSALVVNEPGNDVDLRVEGSTEANLLFTDAGNDRVGVGTNTPSSRFDLQGGDLRIGGSNSVVDGSGNAHLTINDGGNTDVERTLNFPNITGTPTFADHDHSEGGMTTVPNSGLTNSAVTVAGNSVALGASTAVSIDDLSDVSSSTESAGDLPIWSATDSEYQNAALSGGNAIDVTNADASVTLAVTSDGIQTDELDLSIAPTWTGTHTFAPSAGSAINLQGDIDLEGTGADTVVTLDDTHDLVFEDDAGNDLLTVGETDQVVRTPNAGIAVEGNITAFGDGLNLRFDGSGSVVTSQNGTSFYDLELEGSNVNIDANGGLVDLSPSSADLRLATGQAIEDGGGTQRVGFDTEGGSETSIYDNNGREVIRANGNSHTLLYAYSNQELEIWDREGSFTALEYSTSASAPGTATWNADTFIKSGGSFTLGNTSRVDSNIPFEIPGGGFGESSAAIYRFDSTNAGPSLKLRKSNNDTVGSHTALSDGDRIANFDWDGSDGDTFETAVRLNSNVDGAVADGQVPGRLSVQTADSAGSLTEALRINSSQQILASQDGSASAPAIAFGNDTDTGMFLNSAGDLRFATAGTTKFTIGASQVNLLNSADLNLNGGNIQQVGGTTDASSGAIRLAHGAQINARNSGDSADIGFFTTGGAEEIRIGHNSNASSIDLQISPVRIEDGSVGSPALTFSNDTDTGIYRPSANQMAFVQAGSEGARLNSNANWSIRGNSLVQVGGTTDAGAGAIRLANAAEIRWRDANNNTDWTVSYTGGDIFRIESSSANVRAADPLRLNAVGDANVGTGELASNTVIFAADDSADDLVAYVEDESGQSGSINLGSYSSRLNKAEIEDFEPTANVLDVSPSLFTRGNGDGDRRAGFIAEDFIDAGAEWAVLYDEPENVWWEDRVDDDYLAEYGRDGLVPKDINDRAVLAYHHEIIREQEKTIEDLRERVHKLERKLN